MPRSIALSLLLLCLYVLPSSGQTVSGDLKKWHKVTLTFDGPATSENATPNPFLNYRLDVTFSNTDTSYVVPGYFAADGNASETGATAGNKWRVHFAPDTEGTWNYSVSFRTGTNVAVGETTGAPTSFDGLTGSFEIGPTDKAEPDNRARGRLQYVGEHHLRYAETGDYFLKIGADAPENFLAYDDFDNTPDYGGRRKSWGPHVNDWETGDPVWQVDKGKGIIGAVNYLASEGQNVFSFLTMNINGDDENVFPYISDNAADRTRMDCSKLDQWEVVFEHADQLGIYLHFKTQETENDQLLDGGELGVERKLYYRELIARFGHHLALNWNMGEENSNTVQQRKDFAQFFYDNDPYRHHVVIHTTSGQVDNVYDDLVGDQSKYTGPSIQTDWSIVHKRTLDWVVNSANSGKKWVVANDEQGSSNIGVPHDDYTGTPTQKQIRGSVLWGNIMAGGAGVEYYFGYSLPHSDLTCQDFRSRDQMWDYNRYAHQFFTEYVTFWEMTNQDGLVGNPNNDNTQFCLAKPGSEYVIYLFDGGGTDLDLGSFSATFYIRWFNPRTGGALQNGSVTSVAGPGVVNIGQPPAQADEDWTVLVTVDPASCAPAGTACDDGDPSTFDDEEDGACNCDGTPCPPAGTACDDGNPDTINDAQDGFCNCFGYDADNEIWLEAECAQVGGNWTEETDPEASNGAYLLPPNSNSLSTPPASPADLVTFTVGVSQSGPYKVFARTLVTPGEGNSFWVRANDGTWQKWNAINAGNSGSGYQWDQVGNWTGGDLSTPVTFDLSAGMNTVDFSWREPGIRLDKVYVTLTNDSPTTEGPAASNCDDCPPAGTSCDDGDPATENDVEDGACNCAGVLARVDTVLEAECVLVGEAWSVIPNEEASNEAYVLPPAAFSRDAAPAGTEDRIRFSFQAPFAGEYWIFARSMVFDEESNSFWVRINEGDWILWNKINGGSNGVFAWDQLGAWENGQTESVPLTFLLEAGSHTLDFAWREPDIRLDKIQIINENDPPQGLGGDGESCQITSGTSGAGFGEGAGLRVYPNPASGGVFVTAGIPFSQEEYVLEVLDVFGRVRLRQPYISGHEEPVFLDLTGWAAGTYWVRLRDTAGALLVRAFVLSEDR